MSLSSVYKTDNRKETKGLNFCARLTMMEVFRPSSFRGWHSLIPNMQSALEAAVRPYKHLQRTGELKGDLAIKVVMQAFVKGCLQ